MLLAANSIIQTPMQHIDGRDNPDCLAHQSLTTISKPPLQHSMYAQCASDRMLDADRTLTVSLTLTLTDPYICGCVQTVGVRKDDDESAMEKLSAEHEENNADPEEIPDPEEIGEEIEVRQHGFDSGHVAYL